MLRRLYIHNFRCLENFDLPLSGFSSVLLIGRNGSGKTTVGLALQILQRIARGANRVGDLVRPNDFSYGRADSPMRFDIEVEIKSNVFMYSVAFEFPRGFKELRVFEEKLTIDGRPIYTRETAQVRLPRQSQDSEAIFGIDWHFVALPIVQDRSADSPLSVFKQWLANAIIIRPIPSLILGDSEQTTLQPNVAVSDLGAWFSGLVASAPSAYSGIRAYLKEVMPDLIDIKNPLIARESRSLSLEFANKQGSTTIAFADLSDGEKCFMVCAMVIATNSVFGPLICFWDDPDNFLAPSEVGATVIALRRAFQNGGQLIATSHNPEAIRRFSDENTLVLYRKSHLEPTIAERLEAVRARGELEGNLIDALIRGDLGA